MPTIIVKQYHFNTTWPPAPTVAVAVEGVLATRPRRLPLKFIRLIRDYVGTVEDKS